MAAGCGLGGEYLILSVLNSLWRHYTTAISATSCTETSSVPISLLIISECPFISSLPLSLSPSLLPPSLVCMLVNDVYLSARGQLKLGDFGLARLYHAEDKRSAHVSYDIIQYFIDFSAPSTPFPLLPGSPLSPAPPAPCSLGPLCPLQSALHKSCHYSLVSTSGAVARRGALWPRSGHVVLWVCPVVAT